VGIQSLDKGNNAKFPYSKQSNNKIVLHAEYCTSRLRAIMFCLQTGQMNEHLKCTDINTSKNFIPGTNGISLGHIIYML